MHCIALLHCKTERLQNCSEHNFYFCKDQGQYEKIFPILAIMFCSQILFQISSFFLFLCNQLINQQLQNNQLANIMIKQKVIQQYLQQLKAAQKFLSNNQDFHRNHEFYKKHIADSSTLHILFIINAISNILTDDQCDPYAKLLAMRFIKQMFTSTSLPFLILLNSVINPILFDMLLSFKQSGRMSMSCATNIGESFFLEYMGKKYDSQYLKRIGISFYKISFQMYDTISKIFPYLPSKESNKKMPSSFMTNYEGLRNLGFEQLEQKTYYKDRDIEKMNRHISLLQSNETAINKFYSDLTSFLQQSEIYFHIKNLMMGLITSGQQRCVQACLSFFHQSLTALIEGGGQATQQMNYIDFIGSMIRTGDFQSLIGVQGQLLLLLVKVYQNRLMKHEQMRQIVKWCFLVRQTEGFQGRGYKKLASTFASSEEMDKILDQLLKQRQIQKFEQRISRMQTKNGLKMKFIKEEEQKVSQLISYLQGIMKSRTQEPVQRKENEKEGNKQKRRKSEKMSVSQIQKSFDEHPKDIGLKKSQKIQEKRKKINTQENECQQIKIGSDRQIILQSYYMVRPKSKISTRFLLNSSAKSQSSSQFLTPTRKSFAYKSQLQLNAHSNNTQQYLTQNRTQRKYYSQKNSETSSNQEIVSVQQKMLENNSGASKSIENLQLQILKSKKKQMQLQAELMKKNEMIQSLMSKKNFSSHRRKKLELASQLKPANSNSGSKIKSANSKPSSIYDYRSFINNESSVSYKYKKHLLKKKVLIFKNLDIQVGLISNTKADFLQAHLFFTTFSTITDFVVELKCSSNWLRVAHNKTKQARDKVVSESQITIKYNLICNKLPADTLFQVPQVHFSFRLQKRVNKQQFCIKLPITLVKTCQNLRIDESAYQKVRASLLEQKMNPLINCNDLTRFITIDPRICRNFEDFLKYFSEGMKSKTDNRKYISFMKWVDIKFYIEMKIEEKGDSFIRILPANQQIEDILLKLLTQYTSLFSF